MDVSHGYVANGVPRGLTPLFVLVCPDRVHFAVEAEQAGTEEPVARFVERLSHVQHVQLIRTQTIVVGCRCGVA